MFAIWSFLKCEEASSTMKSVPAWGWIDKKGLGFAKVPSMNVHNVIPTNIVSSVLHSYLSSFPFFRCWLFCLYLLLGSPQVRDSHPALPTLRDPSSPGNGRAEGCGDAAGGADGGVVPGEDVVTWMLGSWQVIGHNSRVSLGEFSWTKMNRLRIASIVHSFCAK